ncbi:flagellar hook-associated protein FlgL [Marinibactrum halimedae]|nr:flagellar hook-associated protein FlgL [Marinibactrum halimedae]MCD9458384.1 flagellar hook-associated protein FlgL [Marinibactrum halimedae]
MRVSTNQAFTGGINNIQDVYSRLLRKQEQISTGQEVLVPSDDPVAASRILNINEDNAILDRYLDNITLAENSLSEQETILDGVLVGVQRLEELAIQAGDGVLSNADREALALESQEIYEQLLGLANSQNARGEYIFAGSQSSIQPFQVQPDGTFIYVGDQAEREVEIAGGSYVNIRDSGWEVYMDTDNPRRVDTRTTNINNARIGGGALADELTFDNYFDLYTAVPQPQTTTITLTDNRDATDPDFPDVPVNYTATYLAPDGSGPFAVTAPVNVLNEDTASADGFLTLEVDMTAEMGQVFNIYVPVDTDGFPVGAGDADGAGPGVGEQMNFQIDRQERSGVIETAYALTQLLSEPADTPTDGQYLSDQLGVILDQLDAAGESIDRVTANVGARMNLLEATDALHEDAKLFNAEALSDIEDLDYVAALSELRLQETVLQAAQSSFVTVTNISLFDLL